MVERQPHAYCSRSFEAAVPDHRLSAGTSALHQNAMESMSPGGVQLLHVNGSHWICLSTIQIYNSQNTGIPHIVRQCLASLIKPASRSLPVEVMSSQAQEGCSDCGLFTIANAIPLSSGLNPSNTHWDQSQIGATCWHASEQGL